SRGGWGDRQSRSGVVGGVYEHSINCANRGAEVESSAPQSAEPQRCAAVMVPDEISPEFTHFPDIPVRSRLSPGSKFSASFKCLRINYHYKY
ncbi:MAG: hypothetical protein KAW14_12145, partial [Candidatus Aegiribacteria sp.]|nr:hypothetical protein [Candidatus Aegiribacteria sp.]